MGLLVYTTVRPVSRGGGEVGGLADRIKGIATAFMLAKRLGRDFAIQWQGPHQLSRHFRPVGRDWFAASADIPPPDAHAEHYDAVKYKSVADQLFNGSLVPQAEIVYFNCNAFLSPWTALAVPDVHPDALFQRLFAELFDWELDDCQLAPLFDGRKVLGVQLRTGEGNGWIDPMMGSLDLLGPMLQVARDRASSAGVGFDAIYFASDSARAKQRVAEDYPDILTIEGPIAHFERSKGLTIDEFDFVFREFEALARCQAVCSNAGGFGWTAARIKGRPFYPANLGNGSRP